MYCIMRSNKYSFTLIQIVQCTSYHRSFSFALKICICKRTVYYNSYSSIFFHHASVSLNASNGRKQRPKGASTVVVSRFHRVSRASVLRSVAGTGGSAKLWETPTGVPPTIFTLRFLENRNTKSTNLILNYGHFIQ